MAVLAFTTTSASPTPVHCRRLGEQRSVTLGDVEMAFTPDILLLWLPVTSPLPEQLQGNALALARAHPDKRVLVICGSADCANSITAPRQANLKTWKLRLRDLIPPESPMQHWLSHSPFYKLITRTTFPSHFHVAVLLSALYAFGGTYIDLRYHLAQAPLPQWMFSEPLWSADCLRLCRFPKGSPEVWRMMAHMVTSYPEYTAYAPLPLVWDWRVVCELSSASDIPHRAVPPGLTWRDLAPGDLHRMHFGSLFVNSGVNIGDDIQLLAAAQWLPFVDVFFEREKLHEPMVVRGHDLTHWVDPHASTADNVTHGEGESQRIGQARGDSLHQRRRGVLEARDRNVTLAHALPPVVPTNHVTGASGPGAITIMNGWWGQRPASWPPSPSLRPVMVSMHFSPDRNGFLSQQTLPFLRQHAPIGTRDLATLRTLERLGTPGEFTGCMTLTLQRMGGRIVPLSERSGL
eukprot:jgi/Mesvir1/28845/Mv18973-RA.1